jgi:NHL repeat
VTRTGRSESSPSASKGLLATLRASTSAKGTRAPSPAGRLLSASLLAILALFALTAAPAQALEGYEPATPASFGEPGPGAGQLEAPEGVAVNDETGDVYVADVGNARIDEFEADGKFLRAWGFGVATGAEAFETCTTTTTCRKGNVSTLPGGFTTGAFIAVDNSSGPSKGDVYVGDPGDNTVTKFTGTGALVSWGTEGQLKEAVAGTPFVKASGVAVDTSGNLWVTDGHNEDQFTEAGVFIPATTFNTERGGGGGVAVDTNGALYTVERRIANPKGTQEVLKWEAGVEKFLIESHPTFALAVNPSSNDLILDGGNHIEVYGPFGEPHTAPTQTFATTGLEESTGIALSATALYATQRSADSVAAFVFAPLKPRVEAESVSEVGSASATFHGQVFPQGEPTSYSFEYGTTTAYGKHTPTQSAGAGVTATAVAATVEGLSPDTGYHFRLVASNANGERQGPDVSFSTFPQGILGLPDGRGFELVSPLESGDGEVVRGTRAAGSGARVAYAGQPAEEGNGEGGNPNEEGVTFGGANEYLAGRGAAGWSAVDVQPPGLSSPNYISFSDDLSVGILGSEEPLLGGAPAGQTLYSRDDASGSYRVLGSGAAYAGSTPDGAHVLYSTGPAGLFESGVGASAAVNVLPEGGSAAHAVFGAPAVHESNVSAVGPTGPDFSSAVSGDGSRVFWTQTDAEGHPQRLFVTEHAGSPAQRPVQLDASHAPPHPGGEGRFAAASGDGSRVFFTACSVLTPDSTAAPTPGCEVEEVHGHGPFVTPAGNDLYEANTATGVLSDLSVDQAQNANVVGVLGVSADGSSVYFAAGGALASGAQQQQCVRGVVAELGQGGTLTKCNIYLVHDGGAPQFVAAVTNAEWADWSSVVGTHTAYVAPAGGELVFESGLNLTGFDSRGANEIYMYAPGSGVSCLSCNPSGALTPPGSGASLPGSASTTFALRDVSADGSRVFFQTAESLVPADQNGKVDVYEFERAGAGSCTRPAGCLFVISGGSSTQSSFFVDAGETGEDVFFTSRADLVPADRTDRLELYDARVGATQPPAQPVCSGTGCQGVPAAPPIFSTPSSVTFAGTGNFEPQPPPSKPPPKLTNRQKLEKALKQCHAKRSRAKRRACEHAARRRYPTGRAKRANTHRRAGR